jgi:hypothetical protein
MVLLTPVHIQNQQDSQRSCVLDQREKKEMENKAHEETGKVVHAIRRSGSALK